MNQEHLRGHVADALARLDIIRGHLLKIYAMNDAAASEVHWAEMDEQIIQGHLEAAAVDAHRVVLSLICAKGEPMKSATEAERS